jgi:hypothetical protein
MREEKKMGFGKNKCTGNRPLGRHLVDGRKITEGAAA